MDAHALSATAALWHDRGTMETGRARAIAERLHRGDREEGRNASHPARATCREHGDRGGSRCGLLHEVLEWTAVTERELLMASLTSDELRALRLLNRETESRSDRGYLAHLEQIACATGGSGRLAREVKTADLKDRCLHPHVRRDGWSPPYERALQLLLDARDDPHRAGTVSVG
jgi:hypothetical protein